MKMNKTAAAITAGIITFGAMASASAAHPKMEKVQLDMRTAAQKAQENFNSRSAGKSDQEKEQIAQEIQRDMAAKERTAMQPILQDIRKAIQQVRQEKGLDVILEAGAVIDGGTDVTSEVGAKLTK